MTTVRSLLKSKKQEASTYFIAPTQTVFEALQTLSEHNISALLVKDGDLFVGIVTERDYARKVELHGKSAKETFVSDIMTPTMYTVTPETTVEQCMGLMLKYRIRHLPVVEEERIVGLVSMRDVVQEVLENKENIIAGLENYIMGSSFAT
jgi:CBS domain-containing protein